ncbi:hypothetical protein [Paenibacillus lupini]|uniref:hypothetical protein n=1 Tax=Paenibacillus lupini TaxID=1450204 RepID=UPI00142099C8|nr:hypothetical protein [Paenibacillus lupini]NIK22220.1 hypothetical protein [Paenibacillus lupini]
MKLTTFFRMSLPPHISKFNNLQQHQSEALRQDFGSRYNHSNLISTKPYTDSIRTISNF